MVHPLDIYAIASRRISDLDPIVATMCAMHMKFCRDAGIELMLTSTYRNKKAQDELYAMGRTAPGYIVTDAVGGESFHNYKVAYDVVPIVAGKAMWDEEHPSWKIVGFLGKEAGLDWAGDWKRSREYAHFQYTGGLTIADFQAGKTLQSLRASE